MYRDIPWEILQLLEKREHSDKGLTGLEIAESIGIVTGTAYSECYRLARSDYITSHIGEDRHKYYTITPLGRDLANEYRTAEWRSKNKLGDLE